MTLIEVIDRARSLISDPLDTSRAFPDNTSSFFRDDVLMGYHNTIQEEVQNEIVQSFEDYFTTSTFFNVVDGCATYTMPSGTIKVRRVEDARTNSPIEIRPVSLNSKETRINNYELVSSTFEGGGYYIVGNDIVLTNTPNFTDTASIKLYYVKKLSDITQATAASELPPEHHGVLVWGIVKMALFQEQSDTTKAEIEYEKRISRLRNFVENRQVQRPRVVKQFYGDVD